MQRYNPHIDWVDSSLCFDNAGTACCLHACMQDADSLDGCVIVPWLHGDLVSSRQIGLSLKLACSFEKRARCNLLGSSCTTM